MFSGNKKAIIAAPFPSPEEVGRFLKVPEKRMRELRREFKVMRAQKGKKQRQ